mmetsp:Transcript_115321/g.222312  ORF Transcript_115321/g.222312 Transcript_115321/m.222312 type:complete len:220 (-) Transcript_115321:92-751(-)
MADTAAELDGGRGNDAEAAADDAADVPRGGVLRSERHPRVPDSHISWDEEGIAEHDKTRGTRMKITEPKTPFAYSPASDASEEEDVQEGAVSREAGKAADPAELAARLLQLDGEGANRSLPEPPSALPTEAADIVAGAASVSSAADKGSGMSACGVKRPAAELLQPVTSSVQFAAPEPRPSSASFRAKRARHYNEFQMLQAFKKKQESGELSDDSDDGK